jgi:hypothetical protein
MDDHLDVDRRLGKLLTDELPVPEHREGYRESVAARLTTAAVERAGASRRMSRFLPSLRWMAASRTEERVAAQRHPSRPGRARTSGLRAVAIAFTVVLLLAGVGTGIFEAVTHLGKNGPFLSITDEPMPKVVMSAAEIGRWKKDAAAFANRYFGPWPDADAVTAVISSEFTDDATYYDPSNGEFGIQGKQNIISACRQFFTYYPDIHAEATATYLSADTAAYRLSGDGGLHLFPFTAGRVAGVNILWPTAALETNKLGCFAPGESGASQLRQIAERYAAAWSSGDKKRIAALYRNDATFSDTMLGIQARGSDAIAKLWSGRFGSGTKVTLEIIDLYGQTNGPDPPTAQLPQHGAIIGVGIHFRLTLVAGSTSATIEGLTTFELGDRVGQAFAVDPNGLIAREEVFWDIDSLVAAGLIP